MMRVPGCRYCTTSSLLDANSTLQKPPLTTSLDTPAARPCAVRRSTTAVKSSMKASSATARAIWTRWR